MNGSVYMHGSMHMNGFFILFQEKIRSYERISTISLKGRRQIRTGGILFYFLLVESDRQVLTRACEHFTRAL